MLGFSVVTTTVAVGGCVFGGVGGAFVVVTFVVEIGTAETVELSSMGACVVDWVAFLVVVVAVVDGVGASVVVDEAAVVDGAADVRFVGIRESTRPTGPFKSTSDSGQVNSSG